MVIFRTQAHPSWRLAWNSNNTDNNNNNNPQVNENITMHDRSSQIVTTYCDAIFLNENVNQQRMLILLRLLPCTAAPVTGVHCYKLRHVHRQPRRRLVFLEIESLAVAEQQQLANDPGRRRGALQVEMAL